MDLSQEFPDHDKTENIPEENRLKGDAIGSTLYSERWVLQVLIKLSKLTENDWNSSIEEELCAIWDMTVERDVVNFLLANDFFVLVQNVLECVNVGRCIEIVTGITANLCCIEEARSSLARSDVAILLVGLITSNDSMVLIQVTRLLNACLWESRHDVSSNSGSKTIASERTQSERRTQGRNELSTSSIEISEDGSNTKNPWILITAKHQSLLLNHLAFFLSSSVNEELLLTSLQLMDTLVSVPDLELVEDFAVNEQVSSGLVEALRQLLKGNKTPSRRLSRAIELWARLMGQVVAYSEGRSNLGKSGDILAKCLTKLLILDSGPETLAAGATSLAEPCLCVLETLPLVKIAATTFARLLQALYQLNDEAEKLTQSGTCSSELRSLLHRSMQFVAHQIESSDDLTQFLNHLERREQHFLLTQMEDDPSVFEKIEHCLITIRTNGLVQ